VSIPDVLESLSARVGLHERDDGSIPAGSAVSAGPCSTAIMTMDMMMIEACSLA
jgi:hypothetical protein